MDEFSFYTFIGMSAELGHVSHSRAFSCPRMRGGFGYALFCLATLVCNTLLQSGHQIHDGGETRGFLRFWCRRTFFLTFNQLFDAFLILVMESFRAKWRYQTFCKLLGECNLGLLQVGRSVLAITSDIMNFIWIIE